MFTGSEPLRSLSDVSKIVNTSPYVQAILPTVNTELTVAAEITLCTGMESLRSLNAANRIVNTTPSVQATSPSVNTVEDKIKLL